jgi:hypothetical protein
MSKVILDAQSCAKLAGAKQTVEVTDEAGNVIGHFTSHDAYERKMMALLPPLSREEIADARAEMLAEGGVSTAEILAAMDEAKRRWEATR